MIEKLTNALIHFSEILPLEIFVPVGSFIEEVLAPIPSPFIMTSAGAIAATIGSGFLFLFFLAVIGAIGKVLGAWVLYFISDKAEDLVLKSKLGKFLGFSSKDAERVGGYFNKGNWDYVVLGFIRMLPIVPSAPISIVCGLIKVRIKVFLISSFVGITIRNLIFLYFGYLGISSFENMLTGIDRAQKLIEIGIFVTLGLIIIWAYRKRKDTGFISRILKKFKK